tara:strand:+ start:312 stop:1037 length:726 start_codon:yes stop_codon:yes gene_type:complete
VISAFSLAIAQVPQKEFRLALAYSVALSVITLTVLGGLAWWGLSSTGLLDLPGWLDFLVGWAFETLGWLTFATLTWFLFPAVVSTFVGLFLERVAGAVERRHYADDPPGKDLSIVRSFMITMNFLMILILVNFIGLLLYVPLLFFPILSFLVFYALNGYLLGREYFELVAFRHLDEQTAKKLRQQHSYRLILAGAVIAFLFSIPLVNLVTPLIATAAMVHIFKALARPDKDSILPDQLVNR